MAGPRVWQLTADDSREAGAALARAFMDEPILVAGFRDQALLERYLPLRFAAVVRYGCRFGEVWAVDSGDRSIAGAAVWIREPAPERTPELTIELGYPQGEPEGDAAMARCIAIAAAAEAPLQEMPAPWRYLAVIGVEPALQGRGLGRALLERVLDDAAAAGEVLGLFTDRAVNVPFYERAGMELVWSGSSEDGSVPLWTFRTPMPPA